MTENYILVMSSKESARVNVSDVVFIERNRRKLHIVTGERSFDFYEKLKNIEPLLDERFYPCLKGCYINFDRVKSMSDQSIFFDNGSIFYLGRENYCRTRSRYREYLKTLKKSTEKASEVNKNACNSNENEI